MQIDLTKPLYEKIPQDYKINEELERDFDRQRYINKTFKSRNCGKFKVLGVYGKQGTNRTYLCEFIETGYKIVLAGKPIDLGTIQDKLYKSILGVACDGLVKRINKNPFYYTWLGIIYRCCDMNTKENNLHYMDAEVCDRWLRFEYFLDDIINIGGFKECIQHNCKMEIDKDLLIYGNMLYSKDTCYFIPKKLNTFITNEQIRHKNITTNYIGVGFRKNENTYRSRISINGKSVYLGDFCDPREAYEVYHKVKVEVLDQYLQEYCWLPDTIKESCKEFLRKQYDEVISRNQA